MRLPLRWKLLVLAGLAPAVLALGTYAYLSQVVSEHVRRDVDDSLARACLAFERQLADRQETQSVAASMIAKDPSFYAAVGLPSGATDPSVRSTVRGVAVGFQKMTRADAFEVWDRRGRVLASLGHDVSTKEDRTRLIRVALQGRAYSGIVSRDETHWQVVVQPVRMDGAVVGALLLGSEIGPKLAHELSLLTRSQIVFVAHGVATASSLADTAETNALLRALGGSETTLAPRELRGRAGPWVVIARPLPGTLPGQRQMFMIQRHLATETAFLRRAQQGLLILALVAVAFASTLGIVTAERITRPILSLVRGAAAMERGDYDAPVVVRGHDEIAYLGVRFREMRSRERDYVASLEEVGRLKSEFVSLASHELITPVSVIKGYHDLFSTGALGPVTPAQQRALVAMQDSLGGLIEITENATRLAQIESERLVLERSDQSLATIVDRAIDDARKNFGQRRIEVVRHVAEAAIQLHADGPRLSQAIANLVRNGVRFTQDGGLVEVRARGDHVACVFEVEDNGIGMTLEQQRLLLSRAFVVRDVLHHHSSNTLEFGSAGLGLGVAIARGIIEAHGGSISVTSAPGAGTTMRVEIPRLAIMALPDRGLGFPSEGQPEQGRFVA